jgi:hypothetical protein
MKKRSISLDKKLFLKKNVISSLDTTGQGLVLGGVLSDPTSPCGVCAQTQNPGCNATPVTQPVNMCNFAFSKEHSACNASCNVACNSINNGGCGTVISNAGGGC